MTCIALAALAARLAQTPHAVVERVDHMLADFKH